jgi:tRNA pseudouridine38-40 synthase
MARYQIILAYDGTHFAGSQRQAKTRTVQGVVETALRSVGWRGESILLAGRTDSGVHARGQVAAFDMDWAHSPQELLRALNAHLPADVAAQSIREADSAFHPRFDASARRYRYRLFCRDIRDPLRERYAWRVFPSLDGEVLSSLASIWLGEHDFSAFGSPPRPGSLSVRTVMHAAWEQREDEWHFEIEANAFLYHMVRRIVYLQVRAAQGKLSKKDLLRALNQQAQILPGIAPPNGLTLEAVLYRS